MSPPTWIHIWSSHPTEPNTLYPEKQIVKHSASENLANSEINKSHYQKLNIL